MLSRRLVLLAPRSRPNLDIAISEDLRIAMKNVTAPGGGSASSMTDWTVCHLPMKLDIEWPTNWMTQQFPVRILF